MSGQKKNIQFILKKSLLSQSNSFSNVGSHPNMFIPGSWFSLMTFTIFDINQTGGQWFYRITKILGCEVQLDELN